MSIKSETINDESMTLSPGDRIICVSISVIGNAVVSTHYGTVVETKHFDSSISEGGTRYRQDNTECIGLLSNRDYMSPHISFGDSASVWGPESAKDELIILCRDALIGQVHKNIANYHECLTHLRRI